jgi:DNA invertase Pin-like site-specific DNA recombinase
LRKDGLSINQIAKTVGVSSSTIHRHIQEYMPAAPRSKLDQAKAKQIVELNIAGENARKIAEVFGVCKETVSHLLNIPGIHRILDLNLDDGINDAIGQLICDMYDHSFRKTKIAAVLGISSDEVGAFLEQRYPTLPPKALTEELKSEIRKLIDDGFNYAEIGRSIGIEAAYRSEVLLR